MIHEDESLLKNRKGLKIEKINYSYTRIRGLVDCIGWSISVIFEQN